MSYVGKDNDGKVHRARYEGLIPNLDRRYQEADHGNDAYIKRIGSFAKEQVCRSCHGYRLKEAYLNVKITGKNIGEVTAWSVEESLKFFQNLELTESQKHIAKPILHNIIERLEFLV
jgi:excinuclease ABC subunit A